MVVAEIQAAGGSAPAFVINLNNPENAAIYDLGLPLVAANDVGYKSSQAGILSSIMYLMTNHLTGDAPVMRTA